MSLAIQELDLGGIVDHSLQLVRRRFAECMVVSLATTGPVYVIDAFIIFAEAQGHIAQDVLDLWSLCSFLIYLVFITPLLYGLMMPLLVSEYLGMPITRAEAFRVAKKRFLPLLITRLYRYLAVIAGLFLLIFPGLYSYLRYFFVDQVVIFEDLRYRNAMRRSASLAHHAFGTVLLLGLGLPLVTFGIFAMIEGVESLFLQTCLQLAAGTLMAPVLIAIECVMYFSARCGRDQFDLQLLAQHTGED